MSLQMAELTAGEPLRQNLSEAQLDGSVAFLLHAADLGDKTRPSFDQSHGIGCPRLVEDLGHADLLANQPFHRLSPRTHLTGLSAWAGPHHPRTQGSRSACSGPAFSPSAAKAGPCSASHLQLSAVSFQRSA